MCRHFCFAIECILAINLENDYVSSMTIKVMFVQFHVLNKGLNVTTGNSVVSYGEKRNSKSWNCG